MEWLDQMVKDKKFMDAHEWVNVAQKLNVMLGEEQDILFEMEQKIAMIKNVCIEGGKSVSQCRIMVEGTDTYKRMKQQKALISRVEETIRIAKYQARLKDNEYRNS